MPVVTKNLGQVKAIHIGLTPPSNQSMIWFDTAAKLHKVYNTTSSSWVVQTIGLAVAEAYTPTSSADTHGVLGQITYDNTYGYIKTSAGWGRFNLTAF